MMYLRWFFFCFFFLNTKQTASLISVLYVKKNCHNGFWELVGSEPETPELSLYQAFGVNILSRSFLYPQNSTCSGRK